MREQVDRLLSRERNKKSAHSRGRERAMGPGQNQVGSQRKIQNINRQKAIIKSTTIHKSPVCMQYKEKKSDENRSCDFRELQIIEHGNIFEVFLSSICIIFKKRLRWL